MEDVLKRLLDAERAARDRVTRARQRAEERIEQAEREAEEAVEEAREAARTEADSILRDAEGEMRRAPGAADERAPPEDVEALRQRARGRMEEAASLLCDWVAGKEV